MGLAGAVMTAFYMFRALFLTFWGDFRGWKLTAGDAPVLAASPPGHSSPQGQHGPSSARHSSVHAAHGHHDAAHVEGPHPHESPRAMTWVLAVLGACAAGAGLLNAGLFSHRLAIVDHWLEPVFKGVEYVVSTEHEPAKTPWILAAAGVLAGVVGVAAAAWIYVVHDGKPAAKCADAVPTLYRLVRDKWRIDELYDKTVVAFVDAAAESAALFDKWVVDGILARLTSLVVSFLGTVLRALQSGVVHVYAAITVFGLVAMGWFFVWHPQARAIVSERPGGRYSLEASPGLGYDFRWRTKSPDAPDTSTFGPLRTVAVEVSPGETKRVVLEVRNAFARIASNTFVLTRPVHQAQSGSPPTTVVAVPPPGFEVKKP